jgi:tetratricopeptide (TPR) repeat protein
MSDASEPRGSFLDELKHRKVFRVAAVYLAVGWAIIEAADTILPRMGAPDWVVTTVMFVVLAGFPVSLILAWVFDVRLEGGAATVVRDGSQSVDAPSPATTRRGFNGPAMAALGGVVVVTGGIGWFLLQGAGGPPPAEDISESTLAVMPFSVRGADELDYLREGMVELLSRNLEGVNDLQPVDPATILQMAEGADQSTSAEEAGETARRLGAGQFVTGSVAEVAGQIRIGAELYQLQDSLLTISSGEVQGDTTQLFDLVDELTGKLLAGQSIGMASQALTRRAALFSESLPALKEYLEGEKALRYADFDESISAFRRALELDPDFALAHYRMAVAHFFDFQFAAAEDAVNAALDRSARLSDHDRQLAEALQMNLGGRWDEAEERYRNLLRQYPGDLEAKVLLGMHLSQVGPFTGRDTREARRHLQEVLEMDPKFLCTLCQLSVLASREEDWTYWAEMQRRLSERYDREAQPLAHRILLALDEGDDTLADSLIETIPNLDEDGLGRVHDYGHTVAQGFYDMPRSERMLRLYAEHTEAGPYDAVLAGEMLNITRQSGRYAEANVELGVVMERTPPEDLDPLNLASIVLDMEPAASIPDSLLTTALDRLDGWDPRIPPGREAVQEIVPLMRLHFAGIINARRGDFAMAARQAELIESSAPAISLDRVADGLARSVRAAIAYHQGDMEEVVRVTADMSPQFPAKYYNGLFQMFSGRVYQAEALFAVGRYRDALNWYEWGPPAEAIDMIGLKAFHRAQIYDRLGDEEKAVEQYRNFLKAWANADPEWQFRLDEARDRIQVLTGELVAQ